MTVGYGRLRTNVTGVRFLRTLAGSHNCNLTCRALASCPSSVMSSAKPAQGFKPMVIDIAYVIRVGRAVRAPAGLGLIAVKAAPSAYRIARNDSSADLRPVRRQRGSPP